MESYALLPSLPKISDLDLLPSGVIELGRIIDTLNFNQRFIFYRNNGFLSIVEVDQRTLMNGHELLAFYQYDCPAGFLSWFPSAFDLFRYSDQTGFYPNMMTTPVNVCGEYLAISRDVEAGGFDCPGYSIYNFSRKHHNGQGLMTITWMESFVCKSELLSFIDRISTSYSSHCC